ncbi:CpsD/CapB family tyrosine-protein kinase [Bradyrhizobium sp. WSM1417]|uniref:CpsD/CapB family tyrosine-protein kinase n=1 Tax=Bradyrhizobium sp. WSM1417 TaxID=754500 RepID=UPI0004886ECC|nr:CpsD/CapB family tyrosine-protein kinase [Bradyrhizobium sp. WSM1417]
MDSIKQAVELARSGDSLAHQEFIGGSKPIATGQETASAREVRLDVDHLEANRIVAFATGSESGRYYDMLRTQVLQEMDKKNWQFLAITSPTAGCGKTVTACNLAMSIARLPERSAVVVDLDLRKPMVANYLGLPPSGGVLSVLDGQVPISSAVIKAGVGPNSLFLLPGSIPTSGSSEWMSSQTMTTLLQAIKREFRSHTVIFDLPPMLLGDDVISILPRMDAVLLVTGVGSSSVADVKECQKHLDRVPVVRVVVNKVSEDVDTYYGSYY